MGAALRGVLVLARREAGDAVRNRWVLAAIACLGGLALVLALLGSAAGGASRVAPLEIAVANLSSLSVYLLPLLALLLSLDAIAGEAEQGTLGLLLTTPLSRRQVVAGKFAGHLWVLLVAIVLGYGPVAGLLAWRSGEDAGWVGYVAMMGSSVLLGAVFVALGYLLSVLCRERRTAVGAAVVLWIGLVVLYDLALIGLLVADGDHPIGERTFTALLLLNPGDAYRLLNLLAIDAVGMMAGMGDGVGGLPLHWAAVVLVLAAWVAAPLALSVFLFRRKEL